MKLSICTDVMGNLSFTEMLDKCVALGVEGVEMTGGGWSKGPHFRADELLADKGLLKTKLKEIHSRGLEIAALNCSANPLDPGTMGERHRKEMEQTIRLAGEIGVKKIVTMSGLPPAAPGDTVPNWLVYTKSWPDEMPERDRYQWEELRLPPLATSREARGRGGGREIRAREFLGDARLEPRDAIPPAQ
jgi:sugar phosphate isomerase/epimerase